MTEMLFTDYKNKVHAGLAFYGKQLSEEDMPDALVVMRRAHAAGLVPLRAKNALMVLFFHEPEEFCQGFAGPEARVTLTEAGEAALAQRDQLKSVDTALSLPVSNPAASPLPTVDHCEDDVVVTGPERSQDPAAAYKEIGPVGKQPDVTRHTGQDRKAPRK